MYGNLLKNGDIKLIKIMKEFNINDYIYVKITENGWEHLRKTQSDEYIRHCIINKRKVINGENWYRLIAHSAFQDLPTGMGTTLKFMPTIMIEDSYLKEQK